MVIVTLLVSYGVALQATAADNSSVDSQQIHNLSKRPYQQLETTKVGPDQQWQYAALRVNNLNQQQPSKLHYLSKRSYY
jgi:hypothetical protein